MKSFCFIFNEPIIYASFSLVNFWDLYPTLLTSTSILAMAYSIDEHLSEMPEIVFCCCLEMVEMACEICDFEVLLGVDEKRLGDKISS